MNPSHIQIYILRAPDSWRCYRLVACQEVVCFFARCSDSNDSMSTRPLFTEINRSGLNFKKWDQSKITLFLIEKKKKGKERKGKRKEKTVDWVIFFNGAGAGLSRSSLAIGPSFHCHQISVGPVWQRSEGVRKGKEKYEKTADPSATGSRLASFSSFWRFRYQF